MNDGRETKREKEKNRQTDRERKRQADKDRQTDR